jgi:hypothetical protein
LLKHDLSVLRVFIATIFVECQFSGSNGTFF